ncbi:MAG: DUF2911 domain-containing protein [Chitinophagaceae bacterium]
MKKLIGLIIVFQLFFTCLLAQTALPPVDKSPMDMSYYPNNYPVLKIQDKITDELTARVVYSRPQKAGRPIFGGLVKYGEVWRMGANEATEIEFFKNVRIGGKKISKGRYTLYAIVNENSWTFIVNKETDTWGSFKYNVKRDVIRTDVIPQKMDAPVESLAMGFEKTQTGCNLVIAWDNIKVALPISF